MLLFSMTRFFKFLPGEQRRRIGADHIRKCVRILQLLEVAGQAAGHEYRGLSLPPPARDPKTLVGARERELPDHFRLVRRKRFGGRF